jgi:hypothetical protein
LQESCDSSGMRSLAEILAAVDGDGRIGAAVSIRVLCLQVRLCRDLGDLGYRGIRGVVGLGYRFTV